MEHVSSALNEQMRTYSRNPQTSTPTIPTLSRETHAALFAIINKSRLLNGWTTRTAQELDATIRVWAEIFSGYSIPIDAFDDLYKRAFDVRQQKLASGQDAPFMDATLLVSQWTGSYGLQAERRQREIAAGRTLTANAESVCQHCLGTNFRYVSGGVTRCDHLDHDPS